MLTTWQDAPLHISVDVGSRGQCDLS